MGWTVLTIFAVLKTLQVLKIGVEDKGGEIALLVDDHEVGVREGSSLTAIWRVRETTFRDGLMGFGVFGDGRAVYRDLVVEGPQ